MSLARGADDPATDVAVALLLGVATACWSGLVLGQLGVFRLVPVALAGGAGLCVGLYGARATWRRSGPTRGGAWRAIDGPLVFVLALALYAPGYDTALYGSDATAYLGTGAYLARRGALRIDAPLLSQLSVPTRASLFPAYRLRVPAIRQRCAAGLAYDEAAGDATVYSTFPKLPSVWLAIGFALAALPGAVFTSPLLGAAGVMAYYLFVRRTLGLLAALVAAGLLAPAAPQLMFARVSMSEIGSQFFLWGGLLALSRARESRNPIAAVAAGLGLGCAVLARIDLLLFLPLAALVAWLLGARLRLPAASVAIAAVLALQAAILLALLPSHYRPAISEALAIDGVGLATMTLRQHPWILGTTLGGLLVAAACIVLRLGRGAPGGAVWRAARLLAAGGLVLWGVVFSFATEVPPFTGARLLPNYGSWLVLGLALAGTSLLARRWWENSTGRLAFLVGAVATCHFLYAPHTALLPLWAGRRFVPVILPVLFAAAAMAVVWVTRLGRVISGLLAIAALASNLPLSRLLWHRPFLAGASEAVARIAATIPEDDAVVLLDPAFSDALLDVPLWLVHGREAVQLTGFAGDLTLVEAIAGPLARAGGRPLYLVRHGLLAPPQAPGLRFTQVAEGSYPIVPLDASEPAQTNLLAVRVLRVEELR